MRTLSFALAGLILVLGCRRDPGRMPSDFGPLALGEDWRCPALAGRYAYADEPAGWYLAGRSREYGDSTPIEYFTLAGSADTALHIAIGLLDGRVNERVIRKGEEYSGDYYCEEGWFHMRDAELSDRFDAEVEGNDFHALRRKLRIATGAAGALVARLDRTDYDEFTIWCGDGCKGIPLPWTFETRSTWSRAEVWAQGAPRPSVTAAAREAERLQQDPLWRAEQEAENGPPVVGHAEARKRALAALVPGMLVLAVSPRDSGWHISIEYENAAQIPAYMNRLEQSGPVREVRHDHLYRGRTASGRWTGVVWVRYD